MMSNTIYPDLPEILVSLDADAIALVTLNRPEQRNTFTNQMKDSLVEAFRRALTLQIGIYESES